MSLRPSGRCTTRMLPLYFLVASASPAGSFSGTVGPTTICTSGGTFQYCSPLNSSIIPTGIYCEYCCQLAEVMTVPTGIAPIEGPGTGNCVLTFGGVTGTA